MGNSDIFIDRKASKGLYFFLSFVLSIIFQFTLSQRNMPRTLSFGINVSKEKKLNIWGLKNEKSMN